MSRAILVLGVIILAQFARPASAACTYGSCAPSNIIVNTQVSQYAATQMTGMIADRISQAMSTFGGNNAFASASMNRMRLGGFSLGNGGTPLGDKLTGKFGVWTDISQLWLSDSQIGANYSGQVSAGVVGFDYKFNDRFVLGFAVGPEMIRLDTLFNSGRFTSRGLAGAGYGGYAISPTQSIDFQFGYAGIRYLESHSNISGSFNANRIFGAIDWNSQFQRGPWRLPTSLGLFSVTEWQSAYMESNGNAVAATNPYVVQFRLKGAAGYNFPTAWGSIEPFASTRLEFDLLKSSAPVINSLGQTAHQSNFGATFGLGINTRYGHSTSGSIEYYNTQFRQDFRSSGFRGSIRIEF